MMLDQISNRSEDKKFKGRQRVAQRAVAGAQLCCALDRIIVINESNIILQHYEFLVRCEYHVIL